MTLEDLQKKFNSKNVNIIAGPGGYPLVKIANKAATADICLLGAHVTSYIPANGKDVLWMSPTAIYKEGTGLRGGIPVCWPWFSRDVKDVQNPPSHGCVRTRLWELASVCNEKDDSTVVTFTLNDNAETRSLWNHAFALELKVTVGTALEVALTSVNRDSEPVSFSDAFHTYFNIADISRISIEGFDGCAKVNKVGGTTRETRQGTIRFSGEVDEVYENFTGTAYIKDEVLNRTIVIEKSGSASEVVWNPWIEKSKTFKDFPADGYKTMVCVECANAMANAYVLKPGESAVLSTRISVKAN